MRHTNLISSFPLDLDKARTPNWVWLLTGPEAMSYSVVADTHIMRGRVEARVHEVRNQVGAMMP